jgi:hypothetical protein
VRAVAADWSGAAVGEHRHLWLAECRPHHDGGPPRLARLEGLTRAGATERLLSLADRDPELVVGLDFAFSLPEWFLASKGITAAADLWSRGPELEEWLSGCPPPFWGRPGRPRPSLAPAQHWRRTELATTPRPKSVFQIGGAGAVGTASLRGMPVLDQLSRAGFSIWPMDPPRLPLVLEVWPRLYLDRLVKSHPEARQRWLADRRSSVPAPLRRRAEASADAFDATAAALGLAASVETGPGLPAVRDPVVRLEGWIWGIDGAGATVGS